MSTGARGATDGRLLRVLLLLACLASVVAIAVRVELATKFLEGDSTLLRSLSVACLLSALVIAVMFWRIRHRYASLQQHNERTGAEMSAVMATSHEWLWESTPDLVFVSCSEATGEMLGYPPEELVGRSVFDLADPEFVPAMQAILAVSLRDRSGWRNIYARWRHRNGHFVGAIGSAEPILGSNGEVVGFRGARQVVADSRESGRLAEIRTRVHAYLSQDQVSIALQPVVSVLDGRWHNAEALARFPDGRAPEQCFAEAYEVGLGTELELLALARALEHLAVLPPGVDLSINISAQLAGNPRLHDALRDPGVDSSRVVLEITEHTPIDDYAALCGLLAPLRSRGVRIAVDDTGAGYASFRHVLRLKPDVIKLDRSLLQDLRDDPAARALITAVVMLATELGASVIAEGVEDYSTLDAVAALGVDDAQGYFLARPSADPVDWARWHDYDWHAAVDRRASTV